MEEDGFLGGLAGLGGIPDNVGTLTPDMLDTVEIPSEQQGLLAALLGMESQSKEPMGPPDTRPRGIRNNNPGNVEFRPRDPWEGQVSRETLPSGQPGRFAVFESPEHGIRAMTKTLMGYQEKHGLDTLGKMLNRYAPPSENDPERYARFVGEAANLKPDEPFKLTDDPDRAKSIIMQMIRKENGIMPYSDDQITRGIGMAWPIRPIQSASQ